MEKKASLYDICLSENTSTETVLKGVSDDLQMVLRRLNPDYVKATDSQAALLYLLKRATIFQAEQMMEDVGLYLEEPDVFNSLRVDIPYSSFSIDEGHDLSRRFFLKPEEVELQDRRGTNTIINRVIRKFEPELSFPTGNVTLPLLPYKRDFAEVGFEEYRREANGVVVYIVPTNMRDVVMEYTYEQGSHFPSREIVIFGEQNH